MTNHPIARRKEIAAVYGAGCDSGRGAGHVSGRKRRLHERERLRPVENGIRRHVRAPGDHGDRFGPAGRRLGTTPRRQAHLFDWTRRESGVDGAARSEPVRDQRTCARLRGPARRHRLPRRRLRVHGADAQHVRRRVLSTEGGQGGVGAERPAGIGDRAGTGLCRGVRRPGHLVGTSCVGWRADPGVAPVQRAIAAHPKPGG